MATSVGIKMEMEGAAQFKADLSQINQKSKELAAQMKSVVSGENDAASKTKILSATMENAKAKVELLNKKYAEQEKALNELKSKLEEAEKTYGKASPEAEKLTLEITKQETAMSKTRAEIARAETEYNKASKSMDNLGDESEEAGKQAEKSGDGFTVLKGILANLAAQAITAVVDGMKKLASSIKETVSEVAAMGDEIDKESQKLGLSTKTYQELSYAMERSGADIDSFKKGVININSTLADVQNGVEGASDQFDAMGVSLQNADGSMKSSEEVLLSTIDALASMEDETQRNALANDIFGKSYTELAPLLNSGSEGIKELMQEAEDYGMVMSEDVVKASAEFEDSLTRLQGATNGLKSRLVGQLLPSFSEVIDGLSLMASGSEEGGEKLTQGIEHALDDINRLMPEFIKVGGQILQGIIKGISSNLGGILQSVGDLVTTLSQALIDNLPTITDALGQALPTIIESIVGLVIQLISNLGQILEPILSALPQIITTVLDALASHIGEIVSGIVSVVVLILQHLPEIISAIIEAIPTIIVELIKAIVQNLPTLIMAIIKCVAEIGVAIFKSLGNVWSDYISPWLGSVISGIGEWFSNIFSSIGEFFVNLAVDFVNWQNETKAKISNFFSNIIQSVVEFVSKIPQKIAEGVSGIWEAGKNLVQGLWNGISDAAGWVLDKIKGFGQTILNGIKNIFGIASPSKEMAWVGKMLDEGLAVGISKNSSIAISAADDLMGAIGSTTAGGALMGGTANAVTNNSDVVINVYGAEGQSVEALADVVIDKLQRTIIGSEAVYA